MAVAVETRQSKVLLTMDEVAELLGLSRASVYNLIGKGDLPRVKIGRSARVPASAIPEFVSRKLGRDE